jgi:hypothetical protein
MLHFAIARKQHERAQQTAQRAIEILTRVQKMQDLSGPRAEDIWNSMILKTNLLLTSSNNFEKKTTIKVSKPSTPTTPTKVEFQSEEEYLREQEFEKMRQSYKKSTECLFENERRHVQEMGFRMKKIKNVGKPIADRLLVERSLDDEENAKREKVSRADTKENEEKEEEDSEEDVHTYEDPKDFVRNAHRNRSRAKFESLKPKIVPRDAAHLFGFGNFLKSPSYAWKETHEAYVRDTITMADDHDEEEEEKEDTKEMIYETPEGATCSFRCDKIVYEDMNEEESTSSRKQKKISKKSAAVAVIKDFENPFLSNAKFMSEISHTHNAIREQMTIYEEEQSKRSTFETEENLEEIEESTRRFSARRQSLRRYMLPSLNPCTAAPEKSRRRDSVGSTSSLRSRRRSVLSVGRRDSVRSTMSLRRGSTRSVPHQHRESTNSLINLENFARKKHRDSIGSTITDILRDQYGSPSPRDVFDSSSHVSPYGNGTLPAYSEISGFSSDIERGGFDNSVGDSVGFDEEMTADTSEDYAGLKQWKISRRPLHDSFSALSRGKMLCVVADEDDEIADHDEIVEMKEEVEEIKTKEKKENAQEEEKKLHLNIVSLIKTEPSTIVKENIVNTSSPKSSMKREEIDGTPESTSIAIKSLHQTLTHEDVRKNVKKIKGKKQKARFMNPFDNIEKTHQDVPKSLVGKSLGALSTQIHQEEEEKLLSDLKKRDDINLTTTTTTLDNILQSQRYGPRPLGRLELAFRDAARSALHASTSAVLFAHVAETFVVRRQCIIASSEAAHQAELAVKIATKLKSKTPARGAMWINMKQMPPEEIRDSIVLRAAYNEIFADDDDIGNIEVSSKALMRAASRISDEIKYDHKSCGGITDDTTRAAMSAIESATNFLVMKRNQKTDETVDHDENIVHGSTEVASRKRVQRKSLVASSFFHRNVNENQDDESSSDGECGFESSSVGEGFESEKMQEEVTQQQQQQQSETTVVVDAAKRAQRRIKNKKSSLLSTKMNQVKKKIPPVQTKKPRVPRTTTRKVKKKNNNKKKTTSKTTNKIKAAKKLEEKERRRREAREYMKRQKSSGENVKEKIVKAPIKKTKTKKKKKTTSRKISTNEIENASMYSEISDEAYFKDQNSLFLSDPRAMVAYSFDVDINTVKRKRFRKFALWLNVSCSDATVYVSVDKETMWGHGADWRIKESGWLKCWRTFVFTPGTHTLRIGVFKNPNIEIHNIWLTDKRNAVPPVFDDDDDVVSSEVKEVVEDKSCDDDEQKELEVAAEEVEEEKKDVVKEQEDVVEEVVDEEVKEDIDEEVKEDIDEEVKKDIDEEVKKDIDEEVKKDIDEEVKKDIVDIVEDEVTREIEDKNKCVRFDIDEEEEERKTHRRISLIEKLSMEANDKSLSDSVRRRKSIARDRLLQATFPELLENSSSKKKRNFVNIFGDKEQDSIRRDFSASRRAQNFERNMRSVGDKYIVPLRWQRHSRRLRRDDDGDN